jgi:predicted alpha/beta hydrolase
MGLFGNNSNYTRVEKTPKESYNRSEVDIPIPNDGHRSGTLFTPKKPKFGLVLILPGSGLVTRQGNAPGLKMELYSRLQQSISEKNYAVFYYDRRGVGASTGDFYTTGNC